MNRDRTVVKVKSRGVLEVIAIFDDLTKRWKLPMVILKFIK